MRTISMVLTLVFALTLLPGGSLAADIVASGSCGAQGDNLTWTLDDKGTLTISGEGVMKKYDYSNHAPWYSKKDSISVVAFGSGVTSIGEYAFYGCSNLNNITIPDSITKIGNCAFYGCRGLSTAGPLGSGANIEFCWANRIPDYAFGNCTTLKNIIIPEGITAIGTYAFCFCVGISSITIPDGVTNVGAYAFQGCTNLTSVTIPKSVTRMARAFYDCSSLVTAGPIGSNSNIVYGWTDEIPDGAFADCNHLSSIIIPNGVTSIGSQAFLSCYELTSITIPSSVTSIGRQAFSLCSNLNSITIPSGVTIFSDYLFAGCTSLTDITISNTVTSIGEKTFAGCTDLTSIIIPTGVNNIGEYAFEDCTNLASIIIADNVHSIGYGAFSGCTGLTAITIPDSVSSVGGRAFEGCASLTNITISNSLSNISNLVFGDCTSLKSVTIPNSVTTIASGAFYGCSSLTTVSIPGSITSVGRGAFEGCTGLTTAGPLGSGTCIEFGWMSSIPENAFFGCSGLCNVTLPSGLNSIGSSAFRGCSSLSSIVFPDSLTSIGDCAFSGCGSLNDVVIPEGVASIGREAFSDCSSLTSITIPGGVHDINGGGLFSNCTGLTSAGPLGSGSCIEFGWISNIPDYAFSGCMSLTNCIIPSSVISIGQDAFSGCGNLTSITIPDGVTSISVSAFNGCGSLKSIRIPNGVTSIGNGAFQDCIGLTYVAIPGSVTSIGRLAFSRCTGLIGLEIPVSMNTIGDVAFDNCNNLTEVYYTGSEAQWEQIEKGRYNDCLINAKIHYNSVMPIEGITFNDLSVTADGNSIYWSGSVSVENDTILAATVSITTPTLPDGSFDTGYFRVTEVNAASFDYASIHSGAVATGGVVACTDENGVAKSLSLELPGEYIVAFHVYTAGGIYHQEQRRVTVGSGETKPVLGSFSHTASVTLGGPVYLSGTISVADGGTLQRVTVKCNNAGGSENTVATVAVGAASLDLSTLSFSTAEFPAIFTGPGTYEFVLYAAADNYTVTDNAITTFTVTVTERSSVLPNVVMLEPIVHNSSTVTLRALVTDTGGGEIVNFGFNIYDREDDGVFFAQYSAWHEDGYFQSVSYNATTGIITAELKDYPPERIAYAQAFAIYYIGEVEYCGFSPDRVYFKTMCGDITIDDSVKYALLGDMRMLIVQGTFSRPGSNTEGETLQIEILNYRMEPLENASWFTTVGTEGCFACCCDMRGQYPGRYYVRIQTVGGEEPIWNTAPFDIAEPLTVELLPISEESITAEAFSITARTPDLKGKSIVDYGFNIYSDPEGVNMIAQYSYRYGDGAQKDVVFNSAASSWSAYVDGLEANTSVYVKGFIVYSQKGQEVTGFSNALTEVRTKLASLYIGIGGVKGKQNNILDPTNVMVNGRIAPTDAILSECRIEVRDQNDTLVINTPFTPTGPDFEKKLSFSNLEDGAYAIRAIGVCSDGRTAYSEAVTVYNGSYRIVPMDFGDPEINGSGIANVYFQVLNRHDKPVAGLQISYHYDNPNTNGATITDENGIFCITTPRITSNHTYTATITSHNGPSLENNVVSFSVHVKKLSYEQEWSGALEVGLTGEVNLGASASIGVAKARADAIKLAGGGTLGRELTITDSYEDGHRTLSLSTSFDVGLKIKTSSGITADVVGDIINIKPLDFGVSGTAAKKSEIGVRLTDYDPYNLDQVMTVGKLCLIGPLTTLSVFNNSLLNELNMLMLNISGGDTEKNSVLFKVGANVDVGKLTAGASNVEFSGYLLDQSGDIVLDQSASYDSELHEATFSRSVKTTAGIGFMGKPKVKFKNNAVPVGISDSLSAFDSLIGYKRSNSKEVSAVLDCKSYLPLSVSFKTYIGDETDLMYNKDEVNSYVTYKYSAFDLQKVFGQDSDIFKFAKGNNPLINIQKTINELLDSGVKAAYTVTRKIKQGIKLDLPFEASLGIGAELSFELSGEESCSYSSTTGVYYMNKQYDTTVSDVTDRQIIDKKTSLGSLLVEAYTRVLESIKDKVVSTVDNAVSGIRNGMAYVQGMATDFVISITTIPQSHTKSRSVVTLSTKSGGFGNLGISSTIGEPYVVQGFINKSLDEELSDEELSSCQATLTLSYDEEMLAAAGATADSAISIMFFDRDRNVYIQVSSSEQDKEAMQVTAILTRNGEYILVVDTESPEISDFSTSSLGTQQEVMAYVRDMSGISEFRFWIDDSPILVTEDNLDDYYYESTGVFCYTLEEPLSAGIHTAYFFAADSVGNETAEPYAFPFTVTALVGTVESLSCEEEIINGDGPVLVTATVSGGSSITHASLLCTISDITYVLPMSGENGIWQAEFDPIYGGESVHFEVEAGDDFGNCIHAGSLDIPMDLPEKDVLSIRILSASTITNMTHINLRISTGDQPINGYLVFAFYDSRNRMLSAQTDYIAINALSAERFSVSCNPAVSALKVFLLNPETYTPLCPPAACLVHTN